MKQIIKIALVAFTMWALLSIIEIGFSDPLATGRTYSNWNMIVLLNEHF